MGTIKTPLLNMAVATLHQVAHTNISQMCHQFLQPTYVNHVKPELLYAAVLSNPKDILCEIQNGKDSDTVFLRVFVRRVSAAGIQH